VYYNFRNPQTPYFLIFHFQNPIPATPLGTSSSGLRGWLNPVYDTSRKQEIALFLAGLSKKRPPGFQTALGEH